MLVIAAILFAGACVYVVSYAVLSNRMGERLAALSVEIRGEVDEKSMQSRELDVRLARHVAGGRSASTEIHQWQRKRAELLPHGQPDRPWAWTTGDLKRWAKQQLDGRADDARRRHVLSMVTATVCVVLAAGGTALSYYHFYSTQPNSQLWDAGHASGMPAPGMDHSLPQTSDIDLLPPPSQYGFQLMARLQRSSRGTSGTVAETDRRPAGAWPLAL